MDPEAERAVDQTVRHVERVASVRALGLLDTPPDAQLDRLARLAAALTGAPISLLTLVDAERDFHAGEFGLPEPVRSAREQRGRTFCHYVVASADELALGDAPASAEFSHVPVIATLGVHAYAGRPLRDHTGTIVGTFCVLDDKPRAWAARELQALRELSALAEEHMRHRAALQAARRLAVLAEDALVERETALTKLLHDVRSPLSAVVTATHVLKRGGERALQTAPDLIQRSTTLVRQLLDEFAQASMFEQVDPKATLEAVDAIELTQAAVLMMEHRAGRSNVRLTVRASEPAVVLAADPRRLIRVYATLLGRAIRSGGHGATITLTVGTVGDRAAITIEHQGGASGPDDADNGRGPAWPEPRGDQGGFDPRMATATAIVEAHGGTVAASTLGAAHRVTFTVPLWPGTRPAKTSAPAARG